MLAGSVGLAAGAATSLPFLVPRYDQVRRPSRSRVAILRADEYAEQLEWDLLSGLRLFDLNVRGKTVLLKPNLVDFLPGVLSTPIPFWLLPPRNASGGLAPLPSLWVKARDINATPSWYFPKAGS